MFFSALQNGNKTNVETFAFGNKSDNFNITFPESFPRLVLGEFGIQNPTQQNSNSRAPPCPRRFGKQKTSARDKQICNVLTGRRMRWAFDAVKDAQGEMLGTRKDTIGNELQKWGIESIGVQNVIDRLMRLKWRFEDKQGVPTYWKQKGRTIVEIHFRMRSWRWKGGLFGIELEALAKLGGGIWWLNKE